MQLIRDPIVADSLQLNPKTFAADEHPKNFPKNATQQIAIVNPHVFPSFRSLRLVDKPDMVKY